MPDIDEAAAGEHRFEQVGLLASELEEERTTGPEEARGSGDDPAEDLGAVASAVVVCRVFVSERVARKERERRGGDIGCDGHDHVDVSL